MIKAFFVCEKVEESRFILKRGLSRSKKIKLYETKGQFSNKIMFLFQQNYVSFPTKICFFFFFPMFLIEEWNEIRILK